MKYNLNYSSAYLLLYIMNSIQWFHDYALLLTFACIYFTMPMQVACLFEPVRLFMCMNAPALLYKFWIHVDSICTRCF